MANNAGTLPVDATRCTTDLTASAVALASQATINTTSGRQLVANTNAENDDVGNVVPPELVPPEFSGDGARQRDTRHFATAGDHDAILASTISTTNFAALDNADNNDVGIVVPPKLVPPEFANDGAGTTKDTRHFATTRVDAGTLHSTTLTATTMTTVPCCVQVHNNARRQRRSARNATGGCQQQR